MTANAEKIAAGLTPFQQKMLLGDYEPEEATGADASALIAAGCWLYDREKQRPGSEFYELEVTELGERVQSFLSAKEAPHA